MHGRYFLWIAQTYYKVGGGGGGVSSPPKVAPTTWRPKEVIYMGVGHEAPLFDKVAPDFLETRFRHPVCDTILGVAYNPPSYFERG